MICPDDGQQVMAFCCHDKRVVCFAVAAYDDTGMPIPNRSMWACVSISQFSGYESQNPAGVEERSLTFFIIIVSCIDDFRVYIQYVFAS